MDSKLIELTEDFLKKLDKNELIQEYKELKSRILNNKELLKDIELFQKMNSYDPSYQNQKHKLFTDNDYKRYLEIENELYFWTLEMSNSLKDITRGDKICES